MLLFHEDEEKNEKSTSSNLKSNSSRCLKKSTRQKQIKPIRKKKQSPGIDWTCGWDVGRIGGGLLRIYLAYWAAVFWVRQPGTSTLVSSFPLWCSSHTQAFNQTFNKWLLCTFHTQHCLSSETMILSFSILLMLVHYAHYCTPSHSLLSTAST